MVDQTGIESHWPGNTSPSRSSLSIAPFRRSLRAGPSRRRGVRPGSAGSRCCIRSCALAWVARLEIETIATTVRVILRRPIPVLVVHSFTGGVWYRRLMNGDTGADIVDVGKMSIRSEDPYLRVGRLRKGGGAPAFAATPLRPSLGDKNSASWNRSPWRRNETASGAVCRCPLNRQEYKSYYSRPDEWLKTRRVRTVCYSAPPLNG